MQITDAELSIQKILGVYKGRIAPASPLCTDRKSDCFVYVLSGEAEYTFNGRKEIAAAGDVIYLAHRSNYAIHVEDPQYTFVYIDFFWGSPGPFENRIFKSESLAFTKNDFEKMYVLWNLGDISGKIHCWSLLYKIYAEIVKVSLSQYVTPDRKKQIRLIAAYIQEHVADSELSVAQLSKLCGMSTVYFRKIFGYLYHISPVKFITQTRISRAKELLLSETISIAEVAEQCGFSNHYYFSKIFKEETGMTPSQFRKFYTTTESCI